jgi:hypothetical protein
MSAAVEGSGKRIETSFILAAVELDASGARDRTEADQR